MAKEVPVFSAKSFDLAFEQPPSSGKFQTSSILMEQVAYIVSFMTCSNPRARCKLEDSFLPEARQVLILGRTSLKL